jgi:hypothetical protein
MYPKTSGLGLQGDADIAAVEHFVNRSLAHEAPVIPGKVQC